MDQRQTCRNCDYWYCVGTMTHTNENVYQCEVKPRQYLGTSIKEDCCNWSEKTNIIWLFGSKKPQPNKTNQED